MTIPFNNVPTNNRVPLFWAEVDNSRANTAGLNQRTLIIGQALAANVSSGACVPNVPVISQGVSDAKSIGGEGSMLALMTAAYRSADTFGELWYLPLADDASGTAATGTIAITAAPSANGTLYLYIGATDGTSQYMPGRITQNVLSTQTTAQIATALAATINATPNLPVTATASTSTVTLTAKHKGEFGNDISIVANYRGTLGGETFPSGFAMTITAMSGGATNPTLTTALANCGDMLFDFIISPYTDSTSLDALKSFLNDISGRWSSFKQIYGHFFATKSGTLSALTTFGVSRNDQHGTVLGVKNSPTPSWIWSAATTGAAAVSLRNDPARPLQTLTIPVVLAPVVSDRFILSERNTLLYDGISTFTVGDDGTVYIENLITTYQKNAFGNPDDSYLQVETLYTLAYVIRRMRTMVTSKYARVKLAADGTRYAAGSAIVTPSAIKADIIALYKEMEFDGYVQKSDLFAQQLIVQKNTSNPNRVDVLWPGTLINQLRILGLLAQFRLQ